ncbi:MAG: ComEC/Rec2 family competence protein, partial [Bacteroidales bacterium]|nr:ComEC/Rec2 family competence protein [Bacteroidales bacterium]
LAVSGLHTGIIMLITNFLLAFLDYTQKTRIIKCFLIILILWLFAAITGFSASVCRSALMFSMMTVSQILDRSSSTYNTLATSAFILLIINPLLIFNIGFGLSYLAVLAIISITPLVKKTIPKFDPVHDTRWIHIKKWLIRYFLGIIYVSIAAQIGTSILSIRTFNMFPTYFLLSNILVIPLSYFIMVTSILLLAVSWCSPLMWLTTEVLKFFLGLLTGSVSWIESLPAASINDIFITNISSLLLYASMATFVILAHYKRAIFLKTALILLCLFAASITIFDSAKNPNSQVIVYNKRNTQLYSIKNGEKMSIITDNAKLDEKSLSPATINAALAHANLVEILNTDTLHSTNDLFWQIDNKTFYNVKSHLQIEIMDEETLPVDYLIVSGNTFINADVLTESFKCSNVIFDSSNSKKFVAARKEEYENKASTATTFQNKEHSFMATVQKLFGGIDIKINSEKCDVVEEFCVRTLNIKGFND